MLLDICTSVLIGRVWNDSDQYILAQAGEAHANFRTQREPMVKARSNSLWVLSTRP
jgi:hypothetical protein